MADQNIIREIAELNVKIAELPKGYISKKIIRGKTYYYHQWSEQGKKQSRYLQFSEVEALSAMIEKRKSLQGQLQKLRAFLGKEDSGAKSGVIKCDLMHKNVMVAYMEIDDATGMIQKIRQVYAPNHLPVGIGFKRGTADRVALNAWWTERSIPSSRSGVREALEILEIANTKALLIKCYGFSLSDQYWIRPEGVHMTWQDINYFRNDFSDDVGDVLFGAAKKTGTLDLSSPDNTSDGNLKKRWKIINGKRCLLKGGSNPYRQQPLNEVIASTIMTRLQIPHVEYTLVWNKGVPYSVCEDFIDENTDLVPAWRIINVLKKSNNESVYAHFLRCCEHLRISGAKEFLDKMIVLDYLIANEDRHLNNFGVIRNAETLEWIGFAPIYDSGSSLGYDKLPAQIMTGDEVECKPFKNHHEEQLKLVSSFSWFRPESISDIRKIVCDILSVPEAKMYIDETRRNAIAASVERRLLNLRKYAVKANGEVVDSIEDDRKENTAKTY